MKILEAHNLCFSRGGKQVLYNESLSLEKGERVALLGPTGCGKTSLLRLLSGLERPDQGEIWLRGELVAGPQTFVKPKDRRVGFVFQDLALFEKISVKKNIFYGCQTEEDFHQAGALIRLMGLQTLLDKNPSQLSGGEKQKVALARSLALKPDLIFLDEPFSSIDAHQTDFLLGELRALFTELKLTALMVTHSMDESKAFADRVLRLNPQGAQKFSKDRSC